MNEEKRGKRAAYEKAYFEAHPDKKARHRQMARDRLRRLRLDPKYRAEENLRNELMRARREARS